MGRKNNKNNDNTIDIENDDADILHDDDEVPILDKGGPTEPCCSARFVWRLLSDILFVVGSALYVWLGVVGFEYYQEEVTRNATIPAEVWMADDDYSWQPYLHLWNDDTVFYTHNHPVSQYQILYFAAATCFVFTGLFEFIREPGIGGVLFMIAGGFGVASAVFVDVDNFLANVFNAVSVHLFMVEAIFLFFRHDFAGWRKWLMRLADFFWIGGTVIDVVLSYFGIFNNYRFVHSKVAIAAAVLWLACSLLYFYATLYDQISKSRSSTTYVQSDEIDLSKDEDDDIISNNMGTIEIETDNDMYEREHIQIGLSQDSQTF